MAENVMKLSMILSATDKMSRIIDQATKKSTAQLSAFQKKANLIGGKMQKIGGVMTGAGAAITGALFADVESMAKKAKQIEFSSQKIGMSAENYQKYTKFAEKMGLEAAGFETALGRISKAQVSAAMGNKAAMKVFNAAGLSIYDTNGKLKNSSTVISELSDKFKSAPNGVKKTALAMMLFGKSGKEMIPFLNKGSQEIKNYGQKMEQFGVVLTEEQLKQFKKYREAMGTNKLAMLGVKTTIAVSVLPVIIKYAQIVADVSKKIIGWVQRHKSLTKTILTVAAISGVLLTVLGTTAVVVGTVIKSVQVMSKVYTAFNVVAKIVKGSMLLFKIQYYALSAAQKIATAAQWLWNAAMTANPVGIVIVAIVALIAIVVVAWKKFAWFRAGIKTAWETVKGFGGILKDYVIDRIKSIISGLGSMGKAIGLLFKGKFSEAGKVAWAGVKDLSGYNVTQKAVQKSVALAKSVPATYSSIYKEEKAKEQSKAKSTIQTQNAVHTKNIQRVNNSPALNYAPTIHVNGGSPTVKTDLKKILDDNKTQIMQWWKQQNQNQMRLSYVAQ